MQRNALKIQKIQAFKWNKLQVANYIYIIIIYWEFVSGIYTYLIEITTCVPQCTSNISNDDL